MKNESEWRLEMTRRIAEVTTKVDLLTKLVFGIFIAFVCTLLATIVDGESVIDFGASSNPHSYPWQSLEFWLILACVVLTFLWLRARSRHIRRIREDAERKKKGVRK